MTYDGQRYTDELFVRDGIHLNREGQLRWADGYIIPALNAARDQLPDGDNVRNKE